MKRIITAIFLFLAAVTTVSAADRYRLGYCDGDVSTGGLLEVKGASNADAAIYLPASMLERFAGGEIQAVNAGITTKLNVHSIKVWVRAELDGPDLASAEIDIRTSQRPRDGWNAITLDQPVAITGQQGFYVGYTINQTKTSSLISTVGDYAENGIFVRLGEGAEWTSPTDVGVLSLEAMVTSDNLPQYDLALVNARPLTDFAVDGHELTISYTVRNAAMATVRSYTLDLIMTDGETSKVISQDVDVVLAYGITRTFTQQFPIEGVPAGRNYNLRLQVREPDGHADEDASNNEVTAGTVNVISGTFQRTAVLEEFTTEKCSNCPATAQNLETVLGNLSAQVKKNLAIVCHHSGFYEDFLTQQCDRDLLWFYTGGTTYAPGFMLDREPEGDTPVFQNPGVSALQHDIESAVAEPALVSVEMKGLYNEETQKLDLSISGERVMDFARDPRITVYVCQDNVPAQRQQGYGDGYIHNHVIRAYNSTWGESPVWDGDKYTCSISLEVGASYPQEEMYVVAIMSNYNSSDRTDCRIYNAARADFKSLIDNGGVDTITVASGEARYFTLQGTEVAEPENGLYIRVADGKATKVYIRR